MTRENAAQFLPLVQALADGKMIQVKVRDQWMDLPDPCFNSDAASYRIKPEPREFHGHVSECSRDGHAGYRSFTMLLPNSEGPLPNLGTVRLREVLD